MPADLLLAHELGELHDEAVVAALLHGVGQLGDDQRLAAAPDVLGVGLAAHAHAAAAGLVGVEDALAAEDDAAGREVGSRHVRHERGGGGAAVHLVEGGIVDVGDDRGDDLAQVVRRDVRRHADGDPRRAVDEQVREARRQHDRLLLAAVVVGDEVDGVGVEVAQHLHRHAVQASLGISHGGRRVVVDRAEVALAVDELVAHRELLREAHERVVDRRVAVRVVVAHHVADDRGALAVGARRAEAVLRHGEQHAAVDGLQAVAHVGQRAPDDDRHRVVEVRGAHLVLERAGLDVAAAEDVDRATSPTRPGWRRGGRCPR